jgi:hypothetical protein
MTTLTTPPVAPLLERLYADAESSSGTSISPPQRAQYLERVRSADYVSVDFGGDVEVSLRAG